MKFKLDLENSWPKISQTYNETGGYVINYKQKDGYEEWTECDKNGKKLHYKDSYGHESWMKYDSKGRQTHFKNSTGLEAWFEYDSKGNQIHYKNSNGTEYWYDKHGNKIPDPNLVKEVTIEEIAKAFGVKVKNLKIKK